LHAVAAQPSDYEVRLTDGSCIQASSISASSGQVAINEVGGLTVMADVSEVAQIRAGSTYAQTLTDFPWQATPETVPVPNATAATNAVASVQCWQGTNQEHIMAVKPGTRIDFPFNGQFRAMALSVALSSGAAAGSQATIRIIADGMEVAHTHAIKAGDKPRFVQVALQNPKVVTLVANGAFAGEVLFIDPVAVRK